MEKLEVQKESVLKVFNESGTETRQKLTVLFGEKLFQKDVMASIRSYTDACADQGMEPLALSHFAALPEIDRKHAFASHRITTVIRSLNEGWVPDWNDSNQYKYYVWYKWVGSGVGFSFGDYDFVGSGSSVGARLHFKSRELAIYFAEQFIADINEYFTL